MGASPYRVGYWRLGSRSLQSQPSTVRPTASQLRLQGLSTRTLFRGSRNSKRGRIAGKAPGDASALVISSRTSTAGESKVKHKRNLDVCTCKAGFCHEAQHVLKGPICAHAKACHGNPMRTCVFRSSRRCNFVETIT